MIKQRELPQGWKIARLGDVADYINGRAFKPTEWENQGNPIIRIQNLNKPEANYNYSSKQFEDRYKVKYNDLLFAWSASLGTYIWKGGDAWLNQHIFKVVPKVNCDKRFLFYTLEKTVAELYTKTHGSGMVHVTKGKFEETEILLPSYKEQLQIVEKIEELFSELDKGIENLKTAQQQLKVYRQAVLKWAFEGKLTNENVRDGELPKGWELIKLKQVCSKIQDGSHYSPQVQYDEAGHDRFKYITAKNIRNNYMNLSKITYVDREFHESIYGRCNPEFGDVLLTKDGVNTGEVTLNSLKEPFSLLSSVCIFKVQKELLKSEFLKYFIQSPFGNKLILESMTGTAIKRIILRKIKEAQITLPSTNEQNEIIQEIESRLSVCDKMEETIADSLRKTEALRQSILKRAFEGKLVKNL